MSPLPAENELFPDAKKDSRPVSSESLDSVSQATIALIIPVAPGETAWCNLLQDLSHNPSSESFDEVILSLAEPMDESLQPVWERFANVYSQARTQIVQGTLGRAQQMNLGFQYCHSNWVCFIHADTRVQPDFVKRIKKSIERHPHALLYNQLRFLSDGPWGTRLNAIGACWRSRLFGLPFGDQALALPSEAFQVLGGYDQNLQYGEDHDLVWRAKILHYPAKSTGAKIITSARKYRRQGWLKTTLIHISATIWQAVPLGARFFWSRIKIWI